MPRARRARLKHLSRSIDSRGFASNECPRRWPRALLVVPTGHRPDTSGWSPSFLHTGVVSTSVRICATSSHIQNTTSAIRHLDFAVPCTHSTGGDRRTRVKMHFGDLGERESLVEHRG